MTRSQSRSLASPHGGQLCELMASEKEAVRLREEAIDLPSIDLGPRQLCDLELLLNGGFSPLRGFMGQQDYEHVCEHMRLADDTLWPMPVPLDVDAQQAERFSAGDRVALRHPEGMLQAVLTITDIWQPDLRAEAQAIFNTLDEAHPGVFHLLQHTRPVYIGGTLEGVELPPHHTFKHLRHTPAELRAWFDKLGWKNIAGFQTRNPIHKSHIRMMRHAAGATEANLLIHPVVGITRPGDIDYFVRVRCYQAVMQYLPAQTTTISLLPLAMRMAGPREAMWHAIIRKNHGCSHFIVGKDHAGPGPGSDGKPFYGPWDSRELVARHEEELGIAMTPFEEMVYVEECAQHVPVSEVPSGARALNISGTELRRRLRAGLEIPEWFSYPEVIERLRQAFPPRHKQGFTVFFTGLSGSGKSTIANILTAKLMETGTRPVTLLDGDIVRTHLSSELGFSKEHRELNISRIGFVASEITKNRGIAVCAPIAPYTATRRKVREMIAPLGGFIEVFVATPLEVCEQRDRKGLYAKARAGQIKGFTGIDDPYEEPENAEVVVDTTRHTPEELAHQVLLYLEREGYITSD